MVQKVTKRGVHSGNTLRASNSRYNRQYMGTSSLLRKSRLTSELKDSILDSFNISHDDVAYSLNKKGRWEVPDILRTSILSGSFKDSKTSVKMIVSHNIAKPNRTVGYYSSKGKTRKVESKKKTYFNGESVTVSASLETKNNDQLVDEYPVLQVEVVYPTPKTCSMLHNPKYVGHYIEKPENGKLKSSKARRQRQRLTVAQYCSEFGEDYDSQFDESDDDEVIDEESATYLYGNSITETSSSEELLDDIITHTALIQSLCESRKCNMKREIKNKTETKDRKIYEPLSNSENEQDLNEETESTRFVEQSKRKMDPVYVLLPKKEVGQNFLQERFGTNYTECACSPRKFIVDVSDRMKQRAFSHGCWQNEYVGKWDFTSCVVFCHDAYDINNTETHDVFRISLNMATKAENFRILTLFDYYETCIEDVLHKTVRFLDMLSSDGFVEKETVPPKEAIGMKFENLNRHQSVDKETSSVNRKSMYSEIFNTTLTKSNCVGSDFDLEFISSEHCGICFETIMEDGKHGSALIVCGHWFCDDCWTTHCRSRIAMGASYITCPEYDCSEKVHESVLLTFVNVFEVLNMKRIAINNTLQISENTKWCPNPRCGRAITVNKPEKATDIVCLCGTMICFQCHEKSHWPVACDVALNYWLKMKKLGDDLLFSDTQRVQVMGKQCPKCKRFVEKLGGCFYMNCVCGAMFCWGCLGLYPGHRYTDKCNQQKYGDFKGTSKIVVTAEEAFDGIEKPGPRSDDYKNALVHRNSRHPDKIRNLKQRIREINFKCKSMANLKGYFYFSLFKTNNPTEPEVSQKINDLLSNTVSVYIELHHIAEYSYILLERMRKNGSKCSALRSTIFIVETYANHISDILTESCKVKDFRPLLASLMNIQQKVEHLTQRIVRLMKNIDAGV